MAKKVSRKSKRRLMTFGIISIFAIGYFCFTLIGYIYNYSKLRQEEAQLQNELLTLQDEKSALKLEIEKLKDPNYVIKYAKDKFLYSEENEYVIKINKTDNYVELEKSENNNIFIILFSIIIFVLLLLAFKYKSLISKKI